MIVEIVSALCSAVPLLAYVSPEKRRKREFGLALFETSRTLKRIERRAGAIMEAAEGDGQIEFAVVVDQLRDCLSVAQTLNGDEVRDVLDIKAPTTSTVQINVVTLKWGTLGFDDGLIDIDSAMGGSTGAITPLRHPERGLRGSSMADIAEAVAYYGSERWWALERSGAPQMISLRCTDEDVVRLAETVGMIRESVAAIDSVLNENFDLGELLRLAEATGR